MSAVAILPAGGEQSRWGGEGLKQLVTVDKKPLLVRSVYMLRNYFPVVDILAWQPEIRRHFPTHCYMPRDCDCVDASILSAIRKYKSNRIVVIHGDVMFTKPFAYSVSHEEAPIRFFGTDMEIFGVSFFPTEHNLTALKCAIENYRNGVGRGQLWEFWRCLMGLPIDEYMKPFDASIFSYVRDGTRDFDYWYQYKEWLDASTRR